MNLQTNAIIDLTAAILLLLLYTDIKHDNSKNLKQTMFKQLIIIGMMVLCLDGVSWYLDGRIFYGCHLTGIFINATLFMAQILYSFIWLIYTDYWIHGSIIRLKNKKQVYAIPLIIETLIIIINIFTGWIFTFNEEHIYIRGPLFYPNVIFYGFYFLYATYIAAKNFHYSKDPEQKINCLYLMSFMILPILAIIIQTFVYGISLIAPFFALSLAMIYLNIHRKSLEQEKLKVARRDMELQQANISIMLSQIQPHFLYNALCVIQDLCHDKAPEAEQAVIEFSRFLRGNLDSMSEKKPIPFERELSHTKNYLELEKKRFNDRLTVEYHIGTKKFRMPALTLQPIVENAVRYGICQREDGGTLHISTEEHEHEYVITVKDDGVGFDIMQQKQDGRTHIGIMNVRHRLQKMCGGTLNIESTAGVGTVAMITIPKGEEII